MSDKSDKIFWRQLKLCWTENLVQRKIMPNKKFFESKNSKNRKQTKKAV